MAKLIIVVALCMLAFASAFTFETMGKMEVEAKTCPSIVCLASGGDCKSVTNTESWCPLGQYDNSTFIGATETCNCAAGSAYLQMAATCVPGSTNMKCHPWTACELTAYDSTNYVCRGRKAVGDTCAVTSDCAYPRVCTSGKCVGHLAAGAQCFNTWPTPASKGFCPWGQFCPSGFTVNATCTNWLAVGASCAAPNDGGCPRWAPCGSTTATCDRPVYNTIADGAAPTNFNPMTCVSGLVNVTITAPVPVVCVNYDAEVAKWKAAFPTDTSCDNDAQCYLPGVTIASCVCGSAQTGAAPLCKLGLAPNVINAITITLMKQNGIFESAGATCESSTLDVITPGKAVEVIDSSAYCFTNYKSSWLAAACPIYTVSTSYQCYDQTQGVCNGASVVKSSIFVTMIVAIVAFFTTQ